MLLILPCPVYTSRSDRAARSGPVRQDYALTMAMANPS
ncbi:hypothetical protein HDF08_002791 [Edaphobacter lichenicola]|uniref:Uncharacterized protein n=1 Tax=Tunturiibacter lichenicola TaxID=2051959 RepID=A0A852VHX9_9BACT|nr:hypothetical protein [Edaphobacter lichenicola]